MARLLQAVVTSSISRAHLPDSSMARGSASSSDLAGQLKPWPLSFSQSMAVHSATWTVVAGWVGKSRFEVRSSLHAF